jgi:hypothetical protein
VPPEHLPITDTSLPPYTPPAKCIRKAAKRWCEAELLREDYEESSLLLSPCFASSPWRPHTEDKRMVLEHTHGLFIT